MPALPAVAGGFVAGALLGGLLGGAVAWSILSVAAALAAFSLRTRIRLSSFVLIAAVAFAGAGHARALDSKAGPSPLAAAEGIHDFTGVVREAPRIRGSLSRFSLNVEQLDSRPAKGRISVLTPARTEVRAGDRLSLTGALEESKGFRTPEFGVVAFPTRVEVVGHDRPSKLTRMLHGLRERTVANIERVLSEPESSLAIGMLLGVQRDMPDDLSADLRSTGTMHLVVVSGQNVALMLGLAVAVLSAALSRRLAAAAALLILPAYVVLVGAEPPVVRAALMAVGVTLVDILGRRTPGWIFLVYAAAAMLAIDPKLATSLSFQLSFAATAGVVVVAPPLRDALLARLALTSSGALASVAEVVAISTGAALAVAPVQVIAFGTFPVLQVPANVLVAPLYEATLLAGAAAALFGTLPAAAAPARVLLAPAPSGFIVAVDLLAAVPGTLIEVPRMGGGAIVGWYGVLAVLVWLLGRTKPVILAPATRSGLAITLLLASTAAGLWHSVLAGDDTRASVTVLDVGQGLAILVRDRGLDVLIDTGPPDEAVIVALGRMGQFETLDAVVLTHGDIDHSGGLNAVERRLGTRALLAGSTIPAAEDVRIIDIGDRVRLSDRTSVDVLAPPVRTGSRSLSDNDRSLVLLVSIGERRILLPADIEARAEHWLVRSGLNLRADAIVVPHHGSTSSSTAEFIEAVRPRVAVVSVGASNSYGHPSATVLARYHDAVVLRTDEDGDVTFRSDGRRLWYRAARP